MAIQNSNLPPSFVNEVVKILEDETIVRSNLKSVTDVYSWIEEYGRTSDTKWKLRSSSPSGTRLVCWPTYTADLPWDKASNLVPSDHEAETLSLGHRGLWGADSYKKNRRDGALLCSCYEGRSESKFRHTFSQGSFIRAWTVGPDQGSCCLFLDDNARPHTARDTKEPIRRLGWKRLDTPAYSLDLAPSDFHLFEVSAIGRHFRSNEKVRQPMKNFLR
ncbi:hypothetical protein AVEN_196629-1 [Araneus ventricosus]|uniref:Histone-lysine N-methyltransferase SETMAR n=1 Tax=Araneus ventricosus TaxID=182803 RepID=A0A4Y2E4C9_ARAVE|nr:hypothetical protein AVEN_196629-1 [Araneus ventricosus]